MIIVIQFSRGNVYNDMHIETLFKNFNYRRKRNSYRTYSFKCKESISNLRIHVLGNIVTLNMNFFNTYF